MGGGGGQAMDGLWTEVCGPQTQSNDPHNNQHNPQYANYWAPLTRKRHIPPHSAQPQHTNDWAPRTRKRHQQEHRPQRPTERSDPTQHAEGQTGDCPSLYPATDTTAGIRTAVGIPLPGGGGGSRSAVLRALHSTVPRIMSRSPWYADSTLHWCKHVTYILPATRDTVFFRLHRWVQSTAHWRHGAYGSWHMPHPGECTDVCADWCLDFPILHSLTPLLNPSSSVRLGQQPRGEGGSALPFITELSI